MDGRTIQFLDAPADISGQGHKNTYLLTVKRMSHVTANQDIYKDGLI